MKITITSLLILLFTQLLFGQSALVQQENIETIGENWFNGSVITFDNRYKGTLGTPFLFDDWQPGSITLKSNTVISGLQLKYDVLTRTIYRKTSGENAHLILNHKVAFFTLQGKKYVPTKLKTDKGEILKGFAELLCSGKLKLLALPSCRVRKSDGNNVYGTGRQYDEYLLKKTFYINPNYTKLAIKVKPKKKYFLELMHDKEVEIKKYFKQHKPYLKERKEIKRLVSFYNQLK